MKGIVEFAALFLELMHATCIHKLKKKLIFLGVATPGRDDNFLKNLFTLFD